MIYSVATTWIIIGTFIYARDVIRMRGYIDDCDMREMSSLKMAIFIFSFWPYVLFLDFLDWIHLIKFKRELKSFLDK